VYRARTAGRYTAAKFGTYQVQMIAQYPQQGGIGIGITVTGLLFTDK
jgi:hypothetical protein